MIARTHNLTVRFGRTAALSEVDISFAPGAIHTLVGENGAGKSTLLRVLAGRLPPTSGTVERTDDRRTEWVPQETGMPEDLTVAEWIFLGRELCSRLGLLNSGEMRARSQTALAEIEARISPDAPLRQLTPPQRKQVQLARALLQRPNLLLVDEPTAVLATAEADQVFAALRRLRDQGAAIVYVSHHLTEVLALADEVSVLRDGRLISTDPVAAVDEATLVQRMVGRPLNPVARSSGRAGDWQLRCRNLWVAPVEDFSLTLQAGEIVGLAGLVGSGRSEILEAIAGLRPRQAGELETRSPALLMPEDRGRKGLVATLGVRENIFLPAADRWLRPQQERQVANDWIARLRIRTVGGEASIGSLSGGNQQKVLLARTLRRGSNLLLFDEPTAGIDVGSKDEIHAVIRELVSQGAAILIASSELPELLELCDRIVALYQGRIAGVLEAATASEESIAALITAGQRSPRPSQPSVAPAPGVEPSNG